MPLASYPGTHPSGKGTLPPCRKVPYVSGDPGPCDPTKAHYSERMLTGYRWYDANAVNQRLRLAMASRTPRSALVRCSWPDGVFRSRSPTWVAWLPSRCLSCICVHHRQVGSPLIGSCAASVDAPSLPASRSPLTLRLPIAGSLNGTWTPTTGS